jgi:hypothetical protein
MKYEYSQGFPESQAEHLWLVIRDNCCLKYIVVQAIYQLDNSCHSGVFLLEDFLIAEQFFSSEYYGH